MRKSPVSAATGLFPSWISANMLNTLHYGDNLGILRDKIARESIDLCYIDQPFDSKRNYNQIYNISNENHAFELGMPFI